MGCEICGSEMLPRQGRYGLFFYCSANSKHKTVNLKSSLNYLNVPKSRREAHVNYEENEELDTLQAFEDGDFQSF